MIKSYLGIDIGSISTKGVIIDENNNILASSYLWTKGNPINAVKEVGNLKINKDITEFHVENKLLKFINEDISTKVTISEINSKSNKEGSVVATEGNRVEKSGSALLY